jgi:hypothetical protein
LGISDLLDQPLPFLSLNGRFIQPEQQELGIVIAICLEARQKKPSHFCEFFFLSNFQSLKKKNQH